MIQIFFFADVQKYQALTKTKYDGHRYTNTTWNYMRKILKYDMDIYNLCKAVFYDQ